MTLSVSIPGGTPRGMWQPTVSPRTGQDSGNGCSGQGSGQRCRESSGQRSRVAAPLALVAATAMEMRAVLDGLGLACAVPEPGTVSTGVLRGRSLLFAVCGVGPVNAAITGGMLAARLPSGLLCFGIAGTYDPVAAPMGSAVVATDEIWPEYGVYAEDGADARALGFAQYVPDGTHGRVCEARTSGAGPTDAQTVWQHLRLRPDEAFTAMGLAHPVPGASGNAHGLCVAAGPSVTVAGVSGTPERARCLAQRHAALTENMEGFALALAAVRAGIPFAEVRSVSNIAGERSRASWDMPAALGALSGAAALLFPAV